MAIKKYSKVKFTLRKELIIILSVILAMVVATILLNLPNKKEKFEEKWGIADNEMFVEKDFDELEEVAKSGELVFVYFATADETGKTNLNLIYSLASLEALDFDIDTIYIVDSSYVVGKDREEQEVEDEFAAIEAKFTNANDETITLDQYPNFWVFENGVLAYEIDQDKITEKSGDWTGEIFQALCYSKK